MKKVFIGCKITTRPQVQNESSMFFYPLQEVTSSKNTIKIPELVLKCDGNTQTSFLTSWKLLENKLCSSE